LAFFNAFALLLFFEVFHVADRLLDLFAHLHSFLHFPLLPLSSILIHFLNQFDSPFGLFHSVFRLHLDRLLGHLFLFLHLLQFVIDLFEFGKQNPLLFLGSLDLLAQTLQRFVGFYHLDGGWRKDFAEFGSA
jgi:hypothetical protein